MALEGRWYNVPICRYEPFTDAGVRYSIYVDENGEFDNFDGDNVVDTSSIYSVSGDNITIDPHFGNIVSYQMIYRCEGQLVDFYFDEDDISEGLTILQCTD